MKTVITWIGFVLTVIGASCDVSKSDMRVTATMMVIGCFFMSVGMEKRSRRLLPLCAVFGVMALVFLYISDVPDNVEIAQSSVIHVVKTEDHIMNDAPQSMINICELPETMNTDYVDADDTYISNEIQMLCIEIGVQTGYCPELLMSLIEKESSGRQYAENGPCKGLMQINTDWPEIAVHMAQHGYTDIFDYETNIRLGCFVLDQKREIYGDDIYAVLMAYNGSSNVSERVEKGDYTDYAVNVVNRTCELERLHGK